MQPVDDAGEAGRLTVDARASDREASGTFELSFSTVSSPSLPTDVTLTFQDDDGNGYVDYGGLGTANHDSNLLPQHMAPFLGGLSTDTVGTADDGQMDFPDTRLDATTGTEVARATARQRTQSKPARPPSASIEVSKISPAP